MRWIIRFASLFCLVAALGTGQNVLHVPDGGDLQQAIDAAQLGDTITLAPGAVYTGYFILRNKPGAAFLTIRTAGTNPFSETRITPAEAAGLAKIVAPGDAAGAMGTEAGAHHYRLADMELHAASGVYSYGVVALGSGTATRVSDLAFDIELDRLYIHGDPLVGGKAGVLLNSARTVVKNCWISDFKHRSQDNYAVGAFNGPGPFTIVNNYLEGSAQNLFFGGATPKIEGLVPSDIVIRHNHMRKPPEWMWEVASNGIEARWSVKNILEFKAGRRALIEENLLENNWVGYDQWSYAIVLTVRTQNGSMPWSVVEDLTFVRNVIRNSGSGVNILGRDGSLGGRAGRIHFKDNLFYNIDSQVWGKPAYYTHSRMAAWDGRSRMFQILQGPPDVTIEHNTLIQAQAPGGGTWTAFFDPNNQLGILERFRFANNIATWGVRGSGNTRTEGIPALSHYTPDGVFLNNALIGRDASLYPAGNYFPPDSATVGFVNQAGNDYRLALASPYKGAGTDSKDLGADIAAVEDALRELRFVMVDIKPGENPASVNTKSKGKLPVAILSSATFHAPEMVNRATLAFGATGKERSLRFCNPGGEDVNGDAELDLVCHFDTQQTGFKIGHTHGFLTGRTVQNGLIEGTDKIRIVH